MAKKPRPVSDYVEVDWYKMYGIILGLIIAACIVVAVVVLR